MNEQLFYPTKIIVGDSIYQKISNILNFSCSKILIITGKESMNKAGVIATLKKNLQENQKEVMVLPNVDRNPTDIQVDEISKINKKFKADCIIGIGGTSSIDVAKIIGMLYENGGNSWDYINVKNRKAKKVLYESTPVIAIPTTSGGGSESTPYAVITNSKTKMKKGMKSKELYPKIAIIDTALLKLMPKDIVVNSGFDAFTQALEAFTSKNSNFISDFFAFTSINLILKNFEKSWNDKNDINAKKNMSIAAFLSGLAISITDTNLAHAMSHPLSAKYNIPHGIAVLLCTNQSILYNKTIMNSKYAQIAKLITNDIRKENFADVIITKIISWAKKFNISLRLQDHGVPINSINDLVDDAIQIGGILTNSRTIDKSELKKLFGKAYDGQII